MSPPTPPTSPAAVLAALAARTPPGATLLIATAAGRDRVTEHVAILVLEVRGDKPPVERWGGTLAVQGLRPLGERLGELFRVWTGEVDDSDPGRWSLAWSLPPAPFRLLGRRGIRCAVDGGRVLVGPRRLRAREVTAVRISTSSEGRAAISLELAEGRAVEICHRRRRAGHRSSLSGGEELPGGSPEDRLGAALARVLAAPCRRAGTAPEIQPD